MKNDAEIIYRDGHVVKRHSTPGAAANEASWYRLVPWATPTLLGVDGRDLHIEKCVPASSIPSWRPAGELYRLLCRLHGEGVHHRDLHMMNVVCGSRGQVLLIDWEFAIQYPSQVSYDLYGATASGVPKHSVHTNKPSWHWNVNRNYSVKNFWGFDVSAFVD